MIGFLTFASELSNTYSISSVVPAAPRRRRVLILILPVEVH